MFVKQDTIMLSSKKYCIACLFPFFVVEWIAELRTKSFEKCTEIASKTTKNFEFFDISGQFEALFFYELNLSRNESSPKQQVCPRLKRLSTVVHEVYRYFDKK